MENLEAMLKNDIAEEVIQADVDITIVKDEDNKTRTLNKLKEYEELEDKKAKVEKDLESYMEVYNKLVDEIKINNKELMDNINDVKLILEQIAMQEEDLKKDILEVQRNAFKDSEDNKKLTYNKVTSTYVEETEKNQFDLKSFRENETDFWNDNLSVLSPYAKITNVSDYIKITVK